MLFGRNKEWFRSILRVLLQALYVYALCNHDNNERDVRGNEEDKWACVQAFIKKSAFDTPPFRGLVTAFAHEWRQDRFHCDDSDDLSAVPVMSAGRRRQRRRQSLGAIDGSREPLSDVDDENVQQRRFKYVLRAKLL